MTQFHHSTKTKTETNDLTTPDFSKEKRLAEKLLPEINEFKLQRKTLQLATVNSNGTPNASYARFALAESGFYILVSDLARHGMNLKETANVSVMLVEDESECRTCFARKRVTFDTQAAHIKLDDPEFTLGVAALNDRFGEMIDNLSGLKDFNLYRLRPEKGLYVKGFGQAFAISGADLIDITWQTDGHHGTPKEVK